MDKNWDVIGATAFDQSFNMVQDGSHRLPTPIIKEMASMALKGDKSIPIIGRILEIMVRIIEERLESGKRKNDILQILIDSQKAELKGDRLNNEDIVQENILFLIASSETTSNTMGYAIMHLIEQSEILARLRGVRRLVLS